MFKPKKIFVFLMLGMFLVSLVSAPVNFKQNGETVFSASDNASFTGYLEYYNMVEKMNDYKSVYLLGDANTDGSVRLAIDPDTNYTIVQEKVSGVWQPGSLEIGSNTLRIGKNVGIGGVGHHVVTESGDNHLHLLAHNEFDGQVTTQDASILDAYAFTERLVYQSDVTGSFTGQLLEYSFPATSHLLAKRIYHTTDTTAATEPVRIQIWIGTNDTGAMIFDQTIPASLFPASSETYYDAAGYVEYDDGVTYFLRYSSDADFSLKMESTNTIPWLAADTSFVREDNLLQTMPWENNTAYPVGQYLINNRTIMVSNDSSVQTGSFESNLDKWFNIVSQAAMNFWTKSGNVLYYNDGNVGIGTSSPSQKLEVVGGNIALNANASNGATKIYFGELIDDGPIFSFGYNGTGNSPNNRLAIKGEYSSWTDELWMMKQDGTLYMKGDVGIGTDSPNVKLTLNGTNTNINGPHIEGFTSADSSNPIYQLLGWSSDNVGWSFGGYYSDPSQWKSSSVNGNFQLYKTGGMFKLTYDSGVAAGGVIDWNDGLVMDTSGNVNISTGVLYGNGSGLTDVSAYNSTYDTWAYNQTIPANSYTDSVISINNASWSSTYNATYDSKADYQFGANNFNGSGGFTTSGSLNISDESIIAGLTIMPHLNGPRIKSDYNIDIYTNDTLMARFNYDGQFGIGDVTPNEILDIRSLDKDTFLAIDADHPGLDSGIKFQYGDTDAWSIVSDNDGGDLHIREDNINSRMVFESGGRVTIPGNFTVDGNVGIGINPFSLAKMTIFEGEDKTALYVATSSSTSNGVLIGGDSLTTGSQLLVLDNSNDNSSRSVGKFVIDSGSAINAVGISIQTPGNSFTALTATGSLQINGDINTTTNYYGNGSQLTDIGSVSIVDGSITNPKVSPNAINTTQIIDNTIIDADINSETDITLIEGSLYQGAFVDETGLVFHIPFMEIGTSTQYDRSPEINDGTVTGATVSSTNGKYASGASFDGNDYVNSTSSGFPTSSNVRTFEAVIKPTDITLNLGSILYYGSHSGTNAFSVEQYDQTLRIFTLGDSVASGNIFEENQWYLVQVTYDGTYINAWVNGEKVINNQALTVTTSSGTRGYIGSRHGTDDFFDGNIDYVKFYDRVLSDEELRTHYLRNVKEGNGVIKSDNFKILDNDNNLIFNTNDGKVGILTDNPDSELTIGSNSTLGGKSIHIEDWFDTFILLEADPHNLMEDSNPWIKFSQDGSLVESIVGQIGLAGRSPEYFNYTDTLDNGFLLGTLESATGSEGAMQFGTNNSVKMTIKPNGNIGIGTINPTGKLDISSNSENIILRRTSTNRTSSITMGAGTIGPVLFETDNAWQFNVDDNPVLYIAEIGAVGIGTSLPTRMLEVNGTGLFTSIGIDTTYSDASLNIGDNTTIGGKSIIIEDKNDAFISIVADTDNSGETDNPWISFAQDGLFVRSIMGQIGLAGFSPSNNNYTGTLDNAFLIGTLLSNLASDGALQFGTNNSVRMTIGVGGNVGIGTTTPDENLDVEGGIRMSSFSGCLMMMDTDNLGWTKLTTLNGVPTWSIDSDGIC